MSDASTERAIGNLEGKVELLIQAVNDSRAAGSAGRQRIYEELEEIKEYASDSRRKVDEIADRMTASEPVLSYIKRWKERLIGMSMAFAAIWFVIGAGVALFWKWVATKLGI